MGYQINYGCVSHVGRRRRMNQDNFLCVGKYARPEPTGNTQAPLSGQVSAEQNTLFAVFDGMGGEERGEMASYLAAKAAFDTVRTEDPRQVLKNVCQQASLSICNFVKQNGLGTCGTTAVMTLTNPCGISFCNIGDSKLFRLTEGHLLQLSQDDLSIAPFGEKPPLSQYLGIPPEELTICPHYGEQPYKAGDKYLLCSDGLTDMVPQEQIAQILTKQAPEPAAQLLLRQALDNGGRDNVTLIVLEVEKTKSTGLLQRLKDLF